MLGANNVIIYLFNVNCAFASSQRIFEIFGLMLERRIIISDAAFSPFLYFVFAAIIYKYDNPVSPK